MPASGVVAAQEPDAGADAEDLANGRVHYIASCARCHGVNGGGGEGPPLARSRLDRAPDDAALVEAAGTTVRMVEGAPDNLKVTRPEDLPVAEFLLASRRARDEGRGG